MTTDQDRVEIERALSDIFLAIQREHAVVGLVDGKLRAANLSAALRGSLKRWKPHVVEALEGGYGARDAEVWRSVRARSRDPRCGCGCLGMHDARCICAVCCDLDPAWSRARIQADGELADVPPFG